ncbi:MAG TPA: methyltransferase [Patescibacteria group bacterium]
MRILEFKNNPLSTLLGFLLILIGVALSFISQKKLGDSWTHAASLKAKKLITTGIYKYIRHPIYFGFILSFLGSEILAGSLLWVSFLFLFIPAYYQVKKEDKLLKDKFGNKFMQYKKNTKMFVPFIL